MLYHIGGVARQMAAPRGTGRGHGTEKEEGGGGRVAHHQVREKELISRVLASTDGCGEAANRSEKGGNGWGGYVGSRKRGGLRMATILGGPGR